MRAAVVSDFQSPPACGEFPDPVGRPGYVEVTMLAAGVHQLVRSIASGAHYSSGDELPFVAGIDGIAMLDGVRVYTGGCPGPSGHHGRAHPRTVRLGCPLCPRLCRRRWRRPSSTRRCRRGCRSCRVGWSQVRPCSCWVRRELPGPLPYRSPCISALVA
jgi:hypothetical protein